MDSGVQIWATLPQDKRENAGFLSKCGNEYSGSVKDRKSLDELTQCQALRNDSTPWQFVDCEYICEVSQFLHIPILIAVTTKFRDSD